VSEIQDRLRKMKRLLELRERRARVVEGEDPGIAAIKAEGRAIVEKHEAEERARREQESSQAPVEEPPEEPKKKPKRRRRGKRGGRKGGISEEVANALASPGESAGAANAAGRSLDPADALPDYVLRRDDGSEYTVSPHDPDVGPYARRRP
jgi:hypothetical protein